MTTTAWTVAKQVHFMHAGHGRGKQVHEGLAPGEPQLPPGRVPRVAKLMALALRLDERLRVGEIANYTELAELGHVTTARVSQIMALVYLAPDIQEVLLFLPLTQRGRDTVILADLQPIAATANWRKQRVLWKKLTKHDARV